jgi:chromosome segregation ATPase
MNLLQNNIEGLIQKINLLPDQIKEVELKIHEHKIRLKEIQEEITNIETEVWFNIYDNQEYSNQEMRKIALKNELQKHETYQQLKSQHEKLNNELQLLQIELNALNNRLTTYEYLVKLNRQKLKILELEIEKKKLEEVKGG